MRVITRNFLYTHNISAVAFEQTDNESQQSEELDQLVANYLRKDCSPSKYSCDCTHFQLILISLSFSENGKVFLLDNTSSLLTTFPPSTAAPFKDQGSLNLILNPFVLRSLSYFIERIDCSFRQSQVSGYFPERGISSTLFSKNILPKPL